MEFSTDNGKMWHDEEAGTVFVEGTFRLQTDEYEGMSDALKEVLAANPSELKLDVTGLEFLNSSGINVFAKFVIAVRNAKAPALTVRGNKDIPWQGKSLPNLKKLYSDLDLVID